MKLRVAAVIGVLALATSVWAHSPAGPAKKTAPTLASLQAQIDQIRAKLDRAQASLVEIRAKLDRAQASLAELRATPAPAPRTERAPSSHIHVRVFMDAKGELRCLLDGRPVPFAELGAGMSKIVERCRGAGLEPKDLHGKITAGEKVPYRDVIRVLDVFMRHQITGVSFDGAAPPTAEGERKVK